MPGQRVLQQHLHGAALEAGQPLAIALRVLPEEVLREQRQILAAIAQRRQPDFDRVQPEQQILTESAAGDFLGDCRVRGGDDPDVDPSRPR